MVPTLLLSGLYLYSFKATLLEQEKKHLSQLADNKVKQVEDYISERIGDVLTLSQSSEVIDIFQQLMINYQGGEKRRDKYLQLFNKYKQIYRQYLDYGYLDLIFITPSKEVIFSLTDKYKINKHKTLEQKNIYGFYGVIKKAQFFLESSSSSFRYSSELGQVTAFIESPILRDDKFIGTIILQISSQIIQRVTLDVSGDLPSREVIVAEKIGEYFSYQAKLKYDSKKAIGDLHSVFELPKQLSKAISGIRGTFNAIDYRGKEVISVTRYIPSLRWGLVLKEDLAEVLIDFHDLLKLSIFIFFIVIICVVILAALLGRWLVRPFESITKLADIIASGHTYLH